MIKLVSKTFLKGLAVLLPVFAACYVLKWAIEDSESAMKALLLSFIPPSYYLPGLGIATFLAITFGFGLLMYPWITRQALLLADSVLRRVPIFSSVYSPVKDLMDLLGGDMAEELGEVVMIQVPGTEMETLGFVTRTDRYDRGSGFEFVSHCRPFQHKSEDLICSERNAHSRLKLPASFLGKAKGVVKIYERVERVSSNFLCSLGHSV